MLIRVERNCPWNRCRFCGVYKGRRFSRRPLEHVLRDIDAVADHIDALRAGRCGGAISVEGEGGGGSAVDHQWERRALSIAYDWYARGMSSIFLQDADPLHIGATDILAILRRLRERFPFAQRITTYARSKSVARLTVDELRRMREAGLTRVHIGFESGSDEVLCFMTKGATKSLHIEAGCKVREAGLELSAYYMPGLGGGTLWREHALETADLMNRVNPDFIRLRTLAVPDTILLAQDVASGRFVKTGDVENAQEILLFLESLGDIGSTVVSDHILNISERVHGVLPGERERMMTELRSFLALEPTEQVVYRVGRRAGLFAGVADLTDPGRRAQAERLCRDVGAGPDTIDRITDLATSRFV